MSFVPRPDQSAAAYKTEAMIQTPGRHKSLPCPLDGPASQSPAPIASRKDTGQNVPRQYAPPRERLLIQTPAPRLRNNVGDTDVERMTAAAPRATPRRREPPAAAAPQTTRNLNPACATLKACRHLNPAWPAHCQCRPQMAGSAIATDLPSAWRWPRFQ